MIRSFVGGTLPLAGPAMYSALSPQWAGTLLGLVQIALIPIPFVFYRWGAKIRARSPLIRQMREDQEKSERRQAKARRAEERRLARERGEVAMVDEADDADTGQERTMKNAQLDVTEKK